MQLPKVCICIPCYNNELTIEHTLRSIFAQDYDNLVIKVFDNASQDGTVSIVESLMGERAIELHRRDVNIGGEANFNDCIKHAEGEFCAIFHADDVYEPNIISMQVDFLSRHPQCNAVSTHARYIDERGSLLAKQRELPPEFCQSAEREFSKKDLVELLYKYGNLIVCPSVLFRTATLKNDIQCFIGERFRTSSDLDIWLRLLDLGTFGFINRPLVNYRMSVASYSYNLSKVRVQDSDMFLVLDYHLATFTAKERVKLERYKQFVLMRDRAATNFNRLLLDVRPYQPMNIVANSPLALQSRFHFKCFVLSLAVQIIIHLPFGKKIAELKQKLGL